MIDWPEANYRKGDLSKCCLWCKNLIDGNCFVIGLNNVRIGFVCDKFTEKEQQKECLK